MGYKILGFVVWRGAHTSARRRVRRMIPSRRVASVVVVASAVASIAVVASRRDASASE